MSNKERLLYAFWGITFVGVSAKAISSSKSKPRPSKRTRNSTDEASENNKKTSKTSEIKQLLRLLNGKRTVAFAGLFAFANIARLLIQIKISRKIGKLGSLLSQRKWKELHDAMISFAFWTIPAALTNAFVEFAKSQLSLTIRTKLLRIVHRGYQSDEVKLSELSQVLKDADQIATSDIGKLSDDMATLFQSLFKPITETAILTLTLTRLMGTKQILLCYLYFFVAALWSRKVTPSFTTSIQKVSESEAKYKTAHNRLMEYGEQIDFLQGAKTESTILDSDLQKVDRLNTVLDSQKLASSAIDGYVVRYMGILSSISLMIPALKLEGTAAVEDPTEYFLTVLHLLVNLMGAFKDVATGFRTLGSVKGLSIRVLKLLDTLKESSVKKLGSGIRFKSKDSVVLKGVTIKVPHVLEPLCKDLNLHVEQGKSLFVKGPNGSGKTTLFRVIRGIWEPECGQVGMPDENDCFFLLHKPYILPGLSLRDQICYPHVGQSGIKIDTRIAHALVKVELFNSAEEILKDKVLDSDWLANKDLSAGESQRLACVRLLVRRPKFAFIDEGLSCCTENFEKTFLEYCINTLQTTCISISHRDVARYLHHETLYFNANGTTTLSPN